MCGWAVSIRRRVQLLLRRELLIVMPHVAAGVTSAIPAVEGLQPDGGLGALTPGTQDARVGPRGITVVRSRHSCVLRCSHIPLRRSARVALRRSGRPVRRLNACCSGGLRGQSRAVAFAHGSSTACGDSAFAFSRCTVNDSAYPGDHRSRGLAQIARHRAQLGQLVGVIGDLDARLAALDPRGGRHLAP